MGALGKAYSYSELYDLIDRAIDENCAADISDEVLFVRDYNADTRYASTIR